MKTFCVRVVLFVAIFIGGPAVCRAWDYAGHRLVNQLALASLPKDFPTFVQSPAAKERIAFLAGEPDRWRNTPDLPLKHFNGPDHFIDFEDLAPLRLAATNLSPFRYVFMAQLGAARAARPGDFPPIDAAKNSDHTRELVGFLPWAITEQYGKLKSGFSYLKTLQEGGTAEEVANAHQNIIYIMGVMGHYVGDGAQPLHTTKHFNGWVGENPNHYTTNKSFHSWIDGGYVDKVGIKMEGLFAKVRPARRFATARTPDTAAEVFAPVVDYLLEQFKLVEPLYQLDRDRKLSSKGEPSPEGREFIAGQMLKAGQMLGDLWVTAWQEAPPDTFLKSALAKRKLAEGRAADAVKP